MKTANILLSVKKTFPSPKEIVTVLKRVVERLREAGPGVGIIIRGDSHYSGPEVMEFCQARDLGYILGVAPYETPRDQVRLMRKEARHQWQILIAAEEEGGYEQQVAF